MKILHTADWHLGRKLQDFNRINEQREVLHEIIRISDREQVDAVVIAGDLFESFNPTSEALDLFYKTLHKLSKGGQRAVIAIAGNHDSPERIEAPHPLAAACGIILCGRPQTEVAPFRLDSGLQLIKSAPGFVELKLPAWDFPLRVILTPYANEVSFKKYLGKDRPQEELRELLSGQWKSLADQYCDKNGVNILLSHLYVMNKNEEPPPESEDDRSILHRGGVQALYCQNIPPQIQYTALGHLHRPQVIPWKYPVVYCGSPLSYSFSEADQKKQVEVIELFPGVDAQRQSIPLKKGKKLTKQRFEDVDGAVCWLEDHPRMYVELTMVSDHFLAAKDKRRLYQSHDGIVAIIPELTVAHEKPELHTKVDLNKDIKSLFTDYFHFKKGQAPGPALLEILDEIIHSKS